jgi:hypothetical protein
MALIKSAYFWAVAVRVLLIVFYPFALQGDAVDYVQMATNIADGHGISRCPDAPFPPTNQRPPAYPLVLSLLYALGLKHHVWAGLLNLVFDLFSMRLAGLWGKDLKFKSAKYIPWVVGFCPLLVTFSMYPLTESLSMMLFLAATVLAFRQRMVASGLIWGVLSLTRSYFLLFPAFLFVLRPSDVWKRKSLAVLVLAGFVVPLAWMARNYAVDGRIALTQGGLAGFQSYAGLCIKGFDWWQDDRVREFLKPEPIKEVLVSHCMRDEEVAAIDRRIWPLIADCVTEHPVETVRNFLVKTVNLFINWGQFLPYSRIPFPVIWFINGLMFMVWGFMTGTLLFSRPKPEPRSWRIALSYGLIVMLYVVGVTIPFAVDARYLLAGVIVIVLVCLEAVLRRSKKTASRKR